MSARFAADLARQHDGVIEFMNRTEIESLIAAVLEKSQNIDSEVHGPRHWICVSYLGVKLAQAIEGADPLVAFLFGLFHDSMRENEHDDPKHGLRAATMVNLMLDRGLLPITALQLEYLLTACTNHTTAHSTTNSIVGCCYDADRLTLWRVGIIPSREYLSTAAGKQMAWTLETEDLHDRRLTWDDALGLLFS